MKHVLKSFLLILIVASCGKGSNSYEPEIVSVDMEEVVPMASLAEQAPPPPATELGEQPVMDKKKIIKTGQMEINVKDVSASKRRVDSLVNRYGAYYSSENYYDRSYAYSYSLSIRVPNQQYEKFIAALESGGGEIKQKTIDAQDVTAQYVDTEIRLANKKSYLQRYNEILKQARTIEEVLEVQKEVRILEEEIESAEGQLRYLNDKVNYSTLGVTLTQEKEYKYVAEERDSFWERFKEAVSTGWHGFVSFVLVLVYIWPLWVVSAIVVFVIVRAARKRRARRNQ